MIKIDRVNASICIGWLDLEEFGKTQNFPQKREIEKAGTLYLLDELFGKNTIRLQYTEQNKPYLEGTASHISISHSFDKLVIITNTKESTGIDIELVRDKVINIQSKFLNRNERAFANNDAAVLTTLWSAKEALYKAYGKKELDFKDHIFIEKFLPEENNFYGKIEHPAFKKKYLLRQERSDNYILVHILHEVQ